MIGQRCIIGARCLFAESVPVKIPQGLLASDGPIGVPHINLGAIVCEALIDADQHRHDRLPAPQFSHGAGNRLVVGHVTPIGAGVVIVAGDAADPSVDQRFLIAGIVELDRDVSVIPGGWRTPVHGDWLFVSSHRRAT